MVFQKGVDVPGRRPFNKIPHEELVAIGSKGGKRRTFKKSISHSISAIKQGFGNQSKFFNKFAKEIIRSPERAYILMINYFDEINKLNLNPAQKIALFGQLINAIRVIHGDKQKVESKNLNINVDIFSSVEKAVEEYERAEVNRVPE